MSIPFNADRFWASLDEMARIGATPEGGVKRLALSPEDAHARALLRGWAEAAGLAAMGPAVIEAAGGLA